ncbi:MAG: fluoride efflux transporter CrcB [Alphaproteobacteria bacterium]|nr:fluoride efflux transporter CrcB [Alphaproteobacteria bacterium]
MQMIFLVALGGAAGSVARLLFSRAAAHVLGDTLPWGTLGVNVLGGFLMGVLVEAMALKYSASPEIRALLTTGLLGGFTTFSAFSLEAALMIERGEWVVAGAYMAASVVLSVGALFLGLYILRAAI